MKAKIIKGAELITQICVLSGYRKYEVQDILEVLAVAVAENAKQGYSTHIKGIGVFKPKDGYGISGRSNITGEEFNVVTRNNLSLKIDSLMSNALNGEGNET